MARRMHSQVGVAAGPPSGPGGVERLRATSCAFSHSVMSVVFMTYEYQGHNDFIYYSWEDCGVPSLVMILLHRPVPRQAEEY